MALLDFRYHPDVQDIQDVQGIQDVDDLPDLPPFAPQLRREGHWEPLPDMRPAREVKERLSAALSRDKPLLTNDERQRLRAELNAAKEAPIDEDYPVPLILSQVESIPINMNRGIIGNGGSRKHKRKTLRMRTLRMRTLRQRMHKKRTLKKRYF